LFVSWNFWPMGILSGVRKECTKTDVRDRSSLADLRSMHQVVPRR
jgi:hypothetical protein